MSQQIVSLNLWYILISTAQSCEIHRSRRQMIATQHVITASSRTRSRNNVPFHWHKIRETQILVCFKDGDCLISPITVSRSA